MDSFRGGGLINYSVFVRHMQPLSVTSILLNSHKVLPLVMDSQSQPAGQDRERSPRRSPLSAADLGPAWREDVLSVPSPCLSFRSLVPHKSARAEPENRAANNITNGGQRAMGTCSSDAIILRVRLLIVLD